ncbi:MAG: phosphoesterase PA-phosphatase related [Gallionellaceae bacterium]|nr:MAG: phosphoesterase PA-phosphatase related [Gallionellaceae bacterium]
MDLKTNTGLPASTSSSAWMWGVPLFAALALAILLATDSNVALFEFLNRLMAYASDMWWSHVTVLGDTSLALLLMLLLLGRRPDLVWQFVLAAVFASLWSQGMKELFSSLRPPAVLHEGTFHLIGPMLEFNSFPSGHTTTIFVLAGLFCAQPLSDRLKWLALTLAVLVGLSRIACGVHWPQDVLGGMFGGWLSAVAGVWLAQRWHAGLNVWFQRMLAVLITVLALWTMFYYDNGLPGTWLFQFVIALACLLGSLKGQYRLFKIG